jgi:ribosomal protein S18 acetylase RimI-like enzyme
VKRVALHEKQRTRGAGTFLGKVLPRYPYDAAMITLRRATKKDAKVLGRMGAALARLHHEWDPQRFFVVNDMESGYAWWLGKEQASVDAVVLVAETQSGEIVGYAYGRMEKRDWNQLLDACGAFHDLYVKEGARGTGAGRKLAEAMIAALEEKGAPRIVLHTSVKNEAARKLFGSLGWRETMVEMTRERT